MLVSSSVVMSGMNTRFREQYKKNVLSSTGAGRCRRAQKKLVDRRVSRMEEFSRQRNLAGLVDDSENRKEVVDARKLRLQKWKEDKLQQSLLKKSSEKPAFRCGVVHHKTVSPYLNDISNVNNVKVQKTSSSTVARLERLRLRQKTGAVMKENPFIDDKTKSCAPLNFKFKPPQIRSAVTIEEKTRVITSAANRRGMSRKNNEGIIQQRDDNSLRRVTRAQTRAGKKSNEILQHSDAPAVRKKTKKVKESSQILQSREVPKMETIIENITEEPATPVGTKNLKGSNSPKPNEAAPPGVENVNTGDPEGSNIPEQHVEAVEVPTTPVQTHKTEDCFPIQYSPFVTKERGSSKRRSHLVAEASEKSFGDVSCTTVSSAVTTEENLQHGVLYFRSVTESETERLDTVCQEWLHIKCTEPDLPQEASDMIDTAVGQTQLLLCKKFCQFRNLIDTCENDSGTAKPSVTCSDLDGFWDMMYMQVEDVDLRFRNLQKLKLNNWKEEEELVPVEMKRPVAGGSKKVKKVQKSAKSSLRAMIAAARKKKQQINTEVAENVEDVIVKHMCTPERVVTIRAGSTPLMSHQSRTSLLQRTLLDEHRRHSRGLRRESSPIIMKVTQMAKMCDSTTEPTVQFSETPSTCNQTPRKSILKSVACHLPEPVNKTLFNDNQEVIDESIMKVQDSSDETKDTELYKPRRSLRMSTARRVRFEGTGENSPKEVQPMTPYISHSQSVSQRISLLGNVVDNISVTMPLASGDLICLDSPVSEPRRVTRRSSRLSIRTKYHHN